MEDARKVTTRRLQEMKDQGRKIAMLTAYDYTTARIVDGAGVDAILVGDSAANVMAGYQTTLPITLDQMIYHAASVVRGVKRALVVCDMPFGTYQVNTTDGVRAAVRIMQETGCDALKLEGGVEILDTVRAILDAGIPVMGHLGLTPQSINKFGTYTVRAKEEAEAAKLQADARALAEVGCFGLVLEKNTDHLLSILNSDFYESPFIIWTESMRSQLLSFLQSQQNQIQEGINHFSEEVSEFVYDAIRNELLIGDVYVRVFNEQKPKQFVKAPKYFMGLLTYLRLQRIGPKLNDVWIGYYESTLGDDYVLMMLTSLLILLEDNNELADSIQSADDLLLLFSFLLPRINQQVTWELDTPCTQKAIDILLIITKSPRIASLAIDQHASDIVIRILIQKEFQTQINIFKVLHHICLYANVGGYS